jgi:hypothetical protein
MSVGLALPHFGRTPFHEQSCVNCRNGGHIAEESGYGSEASFEFLTWMRSITASRMLHPDPQCGLLKIDCEKGERIGIRNSDHR